MKLTKSGLIEKGIRVVQEGDNNYSIYRKSRKRKNEHKLKICSNVKHHKYGKDITYQIVGFCDDKPYAITLQRLIYAWFVGDIEEGFDVDHIDDDTLNNRIDNLQLLTRRDNLLKRSIQGNQYTCRRKEGH